MTNPRVVVTACLVLCGTTTCTSEKTLTFKLAPACQPDPSTGVAPACQAVDVSCITHVQVEYVDAVRTDDNGEPKVLFKDQCRAITVKPGTNLCNFGPEVGKIPSLPTDRPFRLKIDAYAQGSKSPGPCANDDRVFGGVSGHADLGGRVPPVLDVSIDRCNAARCGGVSGTVIDLMTGGVAPGVSVNFGYVSLLPPGSFVRTNPITAVTDTSGHFQLTSDESEMISSSGCRAYSVSAGGFASYYCHRTQMPKFPIVDDVVYMIYPETMSKTHTLLREAIDGGTTPESYSVGRVLNSGIGVEGAFIDKMPGNDCLAPPPYQSCVFYPDDDIAGFRAFPDTGKLGLFMSAYRTGINPNDAFGARTSSGDQSFATTKGFFIGGGVFVVPIQACPPGTSSC